LPIAQRCSPADTSPARMRRLVLRILHCSMVRQASVTRDLGWAGQFLDWLERIGCLWRKRFTQKRPLAVILSQALSTIHGPPFLPSPAGRTPVCHLSLLFARAVFYRVHPLSIPKVFYSRPPATHCTRDLVHLSQLSQRLLVFPSCAERVSLSSICRSFTHSLRRAPCV